MKSIAKRQRLRRAIGPTAKVIAVPAASTALTIIMLSAAAGATTTSYVCPGAWPGYQSSTPGWVQHDISPPCTAGYYSGGVCSDPQLHGNPNCDNSGDPGIDTTSTSPGSLTWHEPGPEPTSGGPAYLPYPNVTNPSGVPSGVIDDNFRTCTFKSGDPGLSGDVYQMNFDCLDAHEKTILPPSTIPLGAGHAVDIYSHTIPDSDNDGDPTNDTDSDGDGVQVADDNYFDLGYCTSSYTGDVLDENHLTANESGYSPTYHVHVHTNYVSGGASWDKCSSDNGWPDVWWTGNVTIKWT